MEVDLAGSVAVVAGRTEDLGDALSARLAANGATVEPIAEGDADALAAAIAKRGRLDILINIATDGAATAPAAIDGLCRAAAKAMSGPGGRIVNVASAFGLVAVRGESDASAAAASIFSLTRALALELGGRGVRVNALAVGARGEAKTERLLSHVPLARAATLDEIAAAMLFLVDPDNSYTTGHVLAVDGGWTAGYARNF
jgi:NAD(P)-dependent dehydrogenase (short-subunit alcohol dehydrogenase family)